MEALTTQGMVIIGLFVGAIFLFFYVVMLGYYRVGEWIAKALGFGRKDDASFSDRDDMD